MYSAENETSQRKPIVALRVARITNSPESLETMQSVGPKVCIATASSEGFLGFQSRIQTGILPMAGRWGRGKISMREEMNPILEYQYTMWKSWQAHDEFHETNFEQFFELCNSCLSMVVEGPWEPVYEIVKGTHASDKGHGTDSGIGRRHSRTTGIRPIRNAPALHCHCRTYRASGT
jgi:hypothetical protein